MNIRIGSRGSRLALWQANYLKNSLESLNFSVSIHTIATKGDQIQDLGFDKLEGKGFFTKEIEEALLDNKVDIAVHSLKDLPTEQVEGLTIGAVSYRANPADVLIIHPENYDSKRSLRVKKGSVVGTSSARRKNLVHYFDNEVVLKDIRGNVPTRIQKVKDKKYDAIVLAAAGIERLEIDLGVLKSRELNPKEFCSAPGQGVLAFQCRTADVSIRRILAKLNSTDVLRCTNVERRVLQLLGGGCHVPLGVYCVKDSAGFYHAYSTYSPKIDEDPIRVQLSHSSNFRLAEDVFEQLKLKN